MAGDLKGLTVQIGGDVTELDKALKDVTNRTSAANTELAQLKRLLKIDPGNTDLLAQKQTVLANKIAATREKLATLKTSQEQAAAAFAENKISEADYRKIQREVIAAEQELRKLEQQADETATALKDGGKKGAEGAKETANGEKEVGKEAEKAEGKVSSFGYILKGTLASQLIMSGLQKLKSGFRNLFEGVTESAQAMGTLSDQAASANMGAESLQAWQYAAKMCGIEAEQFVKMAAKQQKSFADAKNGSSALAESYARLGINIADINSSEDALNAVIDGLARCTDETTRNAIANDLFGKSYADLAPLLDLGSKGIAALRDDAQRLGIVMQGDAVSAGDDLADTLDTITAQGDALKNQFASGMTPALQDAANVLKNKLADPALQQKLKNAGKEMGNLAEKGINLAVDVLPKVCDVFSFVTSNGAKLAAGTAAVVVAFKGLKIVNTIKSGVNGLKAAFTGLNTTMAANPIGAILSALGILLSLLISMSIATDEATEKQRAFCEAASDAAESANNAQKARAQAAQKLKEEFDRYDELIEKLGELVDADGNVIEGNEKQVELITGELADALGIEIELVDGQIQNYKDLSAAIGDVITKKRADAYLSKNQTEYDSAVETVGSTETDSDGNYLAGSQMAAEHARSVYQGLKQDLADLTAEYDVLADKYSKGDITQLEFEAQSAAWEAKRAAIASEYGTTTAGMDKALVDYQQAYYDLMLAYDQNKDIIADYEGVQNAVWADDVQQIAENMQKATEARMTAETASLTSLEAQRDASIAYLQDLEALATEKDSSVTGEQVAAARATAVADALEAYKSMVAQGDKYTQEELDAAREKLEAQLAEIGGNSQKEIEKMISALESDAAKSGSHYVDGIVRGVAANRYKAFDAGYTLGQELDRGYRAGTKTESPSKVARKSAAYYPIGLALGIRDEAQAPVDEVLRLSARLNEAMNGNISPEVFEIGAWGGNLSRHEKNAMNYTPSDLSGIYARLDAISARMNELDNNTYLDGELVSRKLTGHTDANLGALTQQQQRGRLT